MKTKETYKIVLLPTESSSKLLLNYDTLYHNDGQLDLDGEVIPQHLYVICDKFKEGDNIVCIKNGAIAKRMNINKIGRTGICVFPNSNDGSIWVKIIATTDKSLTHALAQKPCKGGFETYIADTSGLIPESFIPIYIKGHNKGTPITEVELEYENVVANNPNTEYDYKGIKTNPDGSVIIFPNIKNTEHSTDEVIEFLKKFELQFTNNVNSDNWYKNWITENL